MAITSQRATVATAAVNARAATSKRGRRRRTRARLTLATVALITLVLTGACADPPPPKTVCDEVGVLRTVYPHQGGSIVRTSLGQFAVSGVPSGLFGATVLSCTETKDSGHIRRTIRIGAEEWRRW